MKKLRKKSGFTLVECIVAMAVLSIMSLLLTMILSVALKIRNENMQLEQDLDKQVEKLASGDGDKEDYNDGIKFGDKFTIPGNGSNVEANKVFGDDDGISKLEFDFSKYFEAMGDPPKLNEIADPDKIQVGDWENTAPCFGYVNLDGKINIHEDKTLGAGDIYNVTWKVKFTVKNYRFEDSVKLTLPIGSTFTDWSSTKPLSGNNYTHNDVGYTRKLTKYILMIQPKNAAESNSEETVEVYLYFRISKKDYEENCKNLSYYFTGKDFPAQTSVDVVPTNN